jgi:hypothetical protein
MKDHSAALVPLGCWCYGSPDLKIIGRDIDVGLLCEALVYYDTVLVNVSTQSHLADLIRWLIEQDAMDSFHGLVKEGAVIMFDYSFFSSPIQSPGQVSVANIQDPVMKKPNSYAERYLEHETVRSAFPNVQTWQLFSTTIRNHVIEVKANEYSNAIDHARADLRSERRCSLVLQAFLEELYLAKGLGAPPAIRTSVSSLNQETYNVNWGIHFDEIKQIANPQLNFHDATPVAGAVVCNRLLWTSATQNCDLFLPRPMDVLVGDKLDEASRALIKARQVVEQLDTSVEFPDIRCLVNEDKLSFGEVLKIRRKAARFRQWLQQEVERDRDALVAYHHEVAKESGFVKAGRKALSIFGILSGGAVGSIVGAAIGGPAGGATGAVAGSAVGYIADLASKLNEGWKPVVFGNWLRDYVERRS